MKKAVIITLLSLFFIIGCQDDNSILEPNYNSNDVTLEKGRPILLDDSFYAKDVDSSRVFLQDLKGRPILLDDKFYARDIDSVYLLQKEVKGRPILLGDKLYANDLDSTVVKK